MPVSCQPSDLESAAKCFECLTSKQKETIQTYLLAVIAGGSLDPKVLMTSAKCFQCLTPQEQQQVQVYLLCQILNK